MGILIFLAPESRIESWYLPKFQSGNLESQKNLNYWTAQKPKIRKNMHKILKNGLDIHFKLKSIDPYPNKELEKVPIRILHFLPEIFN